MDEKGVESRSRQRLMIALQNKHGYRADYSVFSIVNRSCNVFSMLRQTIDSFPSILSAFQQSISLHLIKA